MHWFDNPVHPLWGLIESLVTLGTLALFLHFNYKNGWAINDFGTLIGIATALGIFKYGKHTIAKSKPPEDD